MRISTWTAQAVVLAVSAALFHGAAAQSFPTKPIRIVVPFPAGGTTDVVARLVAQRFTESMKQPVVVDNRGGAGGALGADIVAKSAPDGYTLLMANITFPLSSVAQTLAKRSPFNAETDFAGVSIAVYVPFVVTAHPSVPSKDLRDLGTLLASKKLNYNYGSTGPGSVMHVIGETFKRDAKVDMAHIAYKGAAPLKLELLSGRIQVGGDQLATSLAEIRGGQLKALATNGSRRIPALPDVPTVRELGFGAMESVGFQGLVGPAGMPKEIVDRLNAELAKVLAQPDVKAKFAGAGAEVHPLGPAEFAAFVKAENEKWSRLIRERKLQLD